jgi:hypothetical protein
MPNHITNLLTVTGDPEKVGAFRAAHVNVRSTCEHEDCSKSMEMAVAAQDGPCGDGCGCFISKCQCPNCAAGLPHDDAEAGKVFAKRMASIGVEMIRRTTETVHLYVVINGRHAATRAESWRCLDTAAQFRDVATFVSVTSDSGMWSWMRPTAPEAQP